MIYKNTLLKLDDEVLAMSETTFVKRKRKKEQGEYGKKSFITVTSSKFQKINQYHWIH